MRRLPLVVIALLPLGAARAEPVPATAPGEVITVHADRPAPPALLGDPRTLPPYSDAAALGNTWAKAWLLLDIDATGAVRRVKFLKRPGHDLDPIAVAVGLGLRFEPARDAHGHATRTQRIWPLEWPALEWMVQTYGFAERLPDPEEMRHVPCIGSGPLNLGMMKISPVYRDCAAADLSRVDREPWLTHP